jgi:predicted ATPase
MALPAEMTKFVGRERELAEARRLLTEKRLVTLMGAGGVGKTRLALRVAEEARADYRDGVWFVELSALDDAELLAATVAAALELAAQSVRPAVDVLVDHLERRDVLLVLDTCEHLVDACAMLAEVLLRAAPGLRVLATSRQPLDVPGEHTLTILPFDAPDPDTPLDPDSMRAYESVALFRSEIGRGLQI